MLNTFKMPLVVKIEIRQLMLIHYLICFEFLFSPISIEISLLFSGKVDMGHGAKPFHI